ncbi:hypothetical protein MRX96_017827 [Rhipicephalus microplus]
MWFFSIDLALRTFLFNVFLALLIDVVLVAVLKAVARRRRPGVSREQYEREPLSSNLSFPSGFTSRAFLVTLIVVKHSHFSWGDSLAGAILGYIEYHWIVNPLWLSEGAASFFFNTFNALEEPTYDSML